VTGRDRDRAVIAAVVGGIFLVVAACVPLIANLLHASVPVPTQSSTNQPGPNKRGIASRQHPSSAVSLPGRGDHVGPADKPSVSVIVQGRNVQLTAYYAMSFEQSALKPIFMNVCGANGSFDLYVCGNQVASSAELAVLNGRASLQQCDTDSEYLRPGADAEPSESPGGSTLAGDTLCITMSDRVAVCYVARDTTSDTVPAPGLTMDITVYQRGRNGS
jgi:hypothetical protein